LSDNNYRNISFYAFIPITYFCKGTFNNIKKIGAKMEKQKITEMVYNNYEKKFHCAEAIVNTFRELYPHESAPTCKVASGFCGGIGECGQDICGALSGGIIALGSIYGRDTGGEDISQLVALSDALRQLFIKEFTSTVCKNVKENISSRIEYEGCRDVTVKTATLLNNLLMNNK
jgi:C_GCAxxG_C_C family probable redox protein